MAKSDEPITIKKYANRRLYNTGTSTYVTLEDLATMVKAGENFVVYDAKTGDDITRSVLAQIIFEQENKEGQNLLPINFLRQLIRFYGDCMQMLVPRYLEVSIDSLTREQEKFRQQMAQAFGGTPFGALEEQVRRNMEMFERAFAMFAPFARRGRPAGGGRQGRDQDQLRAATAAARSTSSSARWKRCSSVSTRLSDKDKAAAKSADRAQRRGEPLDIRALVRADTPLRRVGAPPRPLRRGAHQHPGYSRSPTPARIEAACSSCTHSATVSSPSRRAKVDERVHEGAIVLRTRQVLHEGAVDLDQVDAELAQIAERGVAGAEIVDRDAAAEILHPRDETTRLIDVVDRRRLGDLDREALGDA